MSLDATLVLARRYARRVVVELARNALIEPPSADARSESRRPELPEARPAAVTAARLPTDEAVVAAPLGDQPLEI